MEATLSAVETDRLMSVLREMAGEPKIVEQRKYKRRSVAMGVHVKVISPGRARHQLCRALLSNVSARGVCLVTERPLAIGDRVLFRLPFREGGGWLVLATIRNQASLPGGTFRSGAEFVSWVDDPTGDTPVPRDWVLSWN